MKHLFPSAIALFAVSTALSFPAQAQDVATEAEAETIRQETVYGDDACSQPATDDEIVVCVRLNESERYRVPAILRGDPNAAENQAWVNKIERIERIGRTGTMSCSPTGLGGFTGCTQEMVSAAVASRKQDEKVDWTAAIAAERQKRIDAIDANARAAEATYQQQEATREQREAEMAAARARLEAEERGETVEPLPPAGGALTVPPGADENPEEDNPN